MLGRNGKQKSGRACKTRGMPLRGSAISSAGHAKRAATSRVADARSRCSGSRPAESPVDNGGLKAELAAIAAEHGADTPAARKAVLDLLKEVLANGRGAHPQPARAGRQGRALRRAARRARRHDHRGAVRLRHDARLSGEQSLRRRTAVAGRGRRLRARNARALLRHRSPLPLSLEADRLVGERDGIHPLHALGPAAEGRARDAHGERDAEGGARGHDDPHRAARGAADRRRRGALRRAADALPERGRRRHGARVHRRQARRARRSASPASGSRATSSSRT